MSTPSIEKKSSGTQTTVTKDFFSKRNQNDNNNFFPAIHSSLHTIKYQMIRHNMLCKVPKIRQAYFNILRPKILIKNELSPPNNLSASTLTNVRHKPPKFILQNEEMLKKIKPDTKKINSSRINHINIRKRELSPNKEEKIKEKYASFTNNSNNKIEKDSTLNQIKSLLYQKIKNTEISNKKIKKFSNKSSQSIEEPLSTNRKFLYYGKFFLSPKNNIKKIENFKKLPTSHNW